MISTSITPELVHVPHLSVEHWEEAKQEVEPDCVGEVEADVPLVGEKDRKPFNSKWKGVNRYLLIVSQLWSLEVYLSVSSK